MSFSAVDEKIPAVIGSEARFRLGHDILGKPLRWQFTPAPRLNAEIAKLAKDPAAREQAASQGVEPVSTTPQEFTEYLKALIDRFGKVVKATGMRFD